MKATQAVTKMGSRAVRALGLLHEAHYLRSLFLARSPQLMALRGSYVGQRCFLLGNGPSLRKIDPKPLAKEITFGSNRIYLATDWLGFEPTFHVTEDRLVLEQFGHEISHVKSQKIYSRRFAEHVRRAPSDILLNIVYDYSDYRNFPVFSKDAAKCVWAGATVSYLMMQLCYYFGFSAVYLVGFDHNYNVANSTKAADSNVHLGNAADSAHFSPDYFGAGVKFFSPEVHRMEASYRRAQAEYTKAGRKIYNATVGGHLEVFERVQYDKMFQR